MHAPSPTATTSADPDAAIMAVLFRKPGFLLARVDQITTALHAARSPATTLAQAEFLLVLDRLGAMPQIALARAAGVDKSTTGLVLDNLQARSWIERGACESDRRRAQVSLTEAGNAAIEDVATSFAALQDELVAPLAPEDRTRLIAMLHRLGSNALSPAPPWRPACAPEAGVLDTAPSFLARRALQHLQASFAEASRGSRTTLRQFSLLFILSRRESITQMAFARLYGLDPSTCGVIVRALTKRGLLAASVSPDDGRERIHRLTEAGRIALGALQAQAERSERAAMRGETNGDIRWLVEQLRRIVGVHSHRLRFPGFLPASLA
ncbi:MarR family winged helix-turn-helix transcriptional regulator [Sphingomonas baiyangensis]|uniref:MarR family transcriptional regulator n=1 Tax=Sphingomonas baiyangensis TaxID=2572576 RepID=A0A4U1L1D7_9SPHN|nr:MarR family transcriptional regulator [Sphingomonas baiyangensis]TKD50651.1 MarR family transcriptional regulator [Sphingomonas baiyangensis]